MSLLKKLAKPFALPLLAGVLAFASPKPADAQQLYFSSELGGFYSSNDVMQKVYGWMFQGKLGLGLESNDGVSGELAFIFSDTKGKPILLQQLPSGESLTSEIWTGSVAARLSKAFGKRDEIRPYIGGQISYDFGTETATDTYQNSVIGTASANASGFGVGTFGGFEIPVSDTTSLSIEGRYTYNWVTPQVSSNSTSYGAAATSASNSGGITIAASAKIFLK